MRKTHKGIQRDKSYYMSSLTADAESLDKTVKGHWRIENSLHLVLAVIMNEDKPRIRNDNAPKILVLMRK